MTTPKFCWSTDQENYHDDFPTREEAVEAAFQACDEEDREDQTTVWTAEAVPYDVVDFLPDCTSLADDLIEGMSENAYDEMDYEESDWPEISAESGKELVRRLRETVEAWAKEHCPPPTFWRCTKIQEHTRIVK